MPRIPTARPDLREKLLGVDVPPLNYPNGSREARLGVEIRNALAFKMYGNATGMPPTHKLVIKLTTSRTSLIVDPTTGTAVDRELRHRFAIQSDRDRHQQVGHDRQHLLAGVLRHPRPATSASPAPAHSATPKIAPARKSRKISRPGWRRSSTPAPDHSCHSGARVGANPESRFTISKFRVHAKTRVPE